ncbi:regulator of sigma E protease [Chitinivorax tropicus]|uniref:Zinc metalloprotease n=1 Tax=Chitinivorax tropicus TaxID=714531 RepID=A0A840MWL2_9PROT|nr:RIP metalloprotease RseP [Chitinivorax tropicus]MBB5019561.1 regulator of sigma E protease [Chitinivorax tropicus]
MQILHTLLAFIVVLGILITFHELGHYWVARRCGIKVLRFSIGFGKPVWITRRGVDQTEWAISAIPLGGYVKMLDETEGPVDAVDLPRAFNRQPVWKRILVVVAGPVANLLLAIVLFWVLLMTGVPEMKPILGDIAPSSPAASAGFKSGEEIVTINGKAVETWQDVRLAVMNIAVDREEATFEVRTAQHGRMLRVLDFSGLDKADLDKDVMHTTGLTLIRQTTILANVLSTGAAAKAGLQVGDRIVRLAGQSVTSWSQLVDKIRQSPAEPLQISYVRKGEVREATILPDVSRENGRVVGKIGVAPEPDRLAMKALSVEVSYGPVEALARAAGKTGQNVIMSLRMFWKMLTGDLSVKNLSGPVTIADYAGQAAKLGVSTFIEFLAWVSISLGVLNLLPIPLLDGGHLMYYTAELIRGRQVSDRVVETGQRVGLALLLSMMLLAFYNDINRLFAG